MWGGPHFNWYLFHEGKRHSGGRWEGRFPQNGRARVGAYRRDFSDRGAFWKFRDDGENLVYDWASRGKCRFNVDLLNNRDYEYFDNRGRHSTGWKTHKRRYQWEHLVREQEKHRKNRERKAVHRKGRLTGNESDSE